ncbi:hypothetical protein MBLNU230_g7606t1 [Neophaeotheca triangularis]
MLPTILSALVGSLLATGSFALPQRHGKPHHQEAKNFIFIVPDGNGPAHHALARDYLSLIREGNSLDSPTIYPNAVDELSVGRVRTHSANNIVTDSAAAGTAFATGFKTNNSMLGITPDGNIAGNVLEAAHLAGYKTGLAVTSIINHATPAAFSAHSESRNNYDDIAAQQIGYSHPLGSVVDIMLGGGRCYFRPDTHPDGCREDDIDLFDYARSNGWTVMEDKAAFDATNGGRDVELPYIGLFSDDSHFMYDIDRQQHHEEQPSLQAMTEAAITSLERATQNSEQGYFLMVEASRIDHGSHANDPVASLHDTIEYEDIVEFIKNHIDSHPDTVMMAAADHETGGLVLDGYDPTVLQYSTATIELIEELWETYNGTDHRSYLANTLLPMYGLRDVNSTEVDALMAMDADDILDEMVGMLNDKAGIVWGSSEHTAVDCDVLGYAHGKQGKALTLELAGGHDNTELVDFMAKTMGIKVSDATDAILAVMAEKK